jgi:hypothetical protein
MRLLQVQELAAATIRGLEEVQKMAAKRPALALEWLALMPAPYKHSTQVALVCALAATLSP